jgi:hypothetical protein
MFNALKYTQGLEKAGFSREQAEISTQMVVEVMNENFASKSDLKELQLTLEARMHSLEMKTENGFRELEYKLTIKLGTMMTIAIGVTTTLMKLLPNYSH